MRNQVKGTLPDSFVTLLWVMRSFCHYYRPPCWDFPFSGPLRVVSHILHPTGIAATGSRERTCMNEWTADVSTLGLFLFFFLNKKERKRHNVTHYSNYSNTSELDLAVWYHYGRPQPLHCEDSSKNPLDGKHPYQPQHGRSRAYFALRNSTMYNGVPEYDWAPVGIARVGWTSLNCFL